MNAQAKIQPQIIRLIDIPLRYLTLHGLGAGNRINDRAKLGQKAVAGRFEYPPGMKPDHRLHDTNMRLECPDRRLFVTPDQRAEADDISGQDFG